MNKFRFRVVAAAAPSCAAFAVGAMMVSGCLSQPDCFGSWPEGKDPATISRRLSDQFLSTVPDNYKPKGYLSTQPGTDKGYGR